MLGSSTSNLSALFNNGVANLTPAGNSSGFYIKSKAEYSITNNKTLNIASGNRTSYIESYGNSAILNTNNGTINCNNSPYFLVINGRKSENKYGVHNKGTINSLNACIGLQDTPFTTGVYNEKTINGMQGDVSFCTNHGIWNKDRITQMNSLYIDNNSTSENGGGLFADSNSTTIFVNSNNIQFNSATNGGGIYASNNATVEFRTNNIVQYNSATNGGGVYAGENSLVYLGENESSATIKNSLINNTGKGNNIYINSYGTVRDYSTYHKVNGNSGLGSVYVIGANEGETQTKGRGVYQIGYSTLYDTTSQYPAYIYLNAGTYIDITKNLPNSVAKDNIQYKPNIYVMTNDKTKAGTTNNRSSEVGRIIANNEYGQGNVDKFSDGTSRFKHIMTGTGGTSWQGTSAKKISYSSRLNSEGKNRLFTNSNINYYNVEIVKNTNYQYDHNNTSHPDTEYSNNGSKNKQVFLTETYNIKYYPVTREKYNSLTQEQLDSITGIDDILNSEIQYTNDDKSYKYAVVDKYWYEDLYITNKTLKSNFGIFDKEESWAQINYSQSSDIIKTYSTYDNDNTNNVYTGNESISLFAIWSNSTNVVISHFMMDQNGNYDPVCSYTSYSEVHSEDENVYAQVYGVPSGIDGKDYNGIGIYKDTSAHTSFETWHHFASVNINATIDENYIRNNFEDKNLIKDNISYYSHYELEGFNSSNQVTSDKCIIKIFYARKNYNIKVSGDDGVDSVGVENLYKYNIAYNNENGVDVTVTDGNSNAYRNMPYPVNNTLINAQTNTDSGGLKLTLYKDVKYNIYIIPQTYFYGGIGIYVKKTRWNSSGSPYISYENIPNASVEYVDEHYLIEYTPGVTSDYYIGHGIKYSNDIGLESCDLYVYAYNEIMHSKDAQIPDTCNCSYYATDESENRNVPQLGVFGDIYGTGDNASNNYVGIFKKNLNNSYTKLETFNGYTGGYSKAIGTTVNIPNYGDVEYRVITDKTERILNIDENLEKQTYNSGDVPFENIRSQKISNYGMIKVGDLKAQVRSFSEYVDNSKTNFIYFAGSTDSNSIFSKEQLLSFNDNDYLPTPKNNYMNGLSINYYRKTFTIKTIAGTNATAAAISSDNFENQSHGQSQITERYYLNANNPFGLAAETKKTIYLDGQIKDGYSGSWTSNYDRYNMNFGYKLNQIKTDVPILENLDVTFTLSASLKRNITITHYLMDTDGIYQLQEDYTKVLTNTSLTSIVPDDYKNSGSNKETNLEYIKDGVKYRYLSSAEYAGDTYTGNSLNDAISLNDNDKNAQIKLFYSRVSVPVYIYANKYIDSISPSSYSFNKKEGENLTYTYANAIESINNGKLMNTSPLFAYFEEELQFSCKLADSSEGEDISFDGYTFGKCNFNSSDLECTTQDYTFKVGTVNRVNISVYGHSEPWKWHVYYHENCKDDEYNCGHEKHMSENDVGMNAGYTNDDKIVDILWNDTINAEGEMFISDSSHKQIKWETNNGEFIDFNDVLSRSDLNDLIDSDSRTIDLYAVWKNIGPKVNIYAEDLYFEVGTDISQDDILKKIHVSDENGKILSNSESDLGVVRIEVDKKYEDRLLFPEGSEGFSDTNLSDSDFDNYINSDNATTYLITVKASKEDVVTYKTYKVIIYENLIGKTYIRAIDKEMLGSLSINSIWRQPNNYARLIKTLNKGRSNSIDKDTKEAKYVFAFNSSDLLDIQAKIKANGYKYKDVIKDENIKKEPEDE